MCAAGEGNTAEEKGERVYQIVQYSCGVDRCILKKFILRKRWFNPTFTQFPDYFGILYASDKRGCDLMKNQTTFSDVEY